MKKLISLILCFFTLFLLACDSPMEKRERNLSELRDEVMVAAGDGMKISLISGVREDPFVIDGAPGEKKPFTVVTITPDGFNENAAFSYSLYIGESKFEGNFSKHPLKTPGPLKFPKGQKGPRRLR